MSTPAGRVLTLSKSPRFGRIEDAFNPTPDPGSRLVLRLPDRLQDGEHVLGRDFVQSHIAERRRVDRERHRPLRPVLLVAEAMADVGDEGIGEGTEFRCGCTLHLTETPIGYWIPSLGDDLTCFPGLTTSICQGDTRQTSKSHLLELAIPAEQEYPPPRGSWADDEIQPAAVGVPTRFGDCCDLAGREPIELLSHLVLPFLTQRLPLR